MALFATRFLLKAQMALYWKALASENWFVVISSPLGPAPMDG